ncbi:MAG TPA: hypothetical protein VER55_04460 [Ardenticatenaceae bacterium]|nr:hypothetical protein [Ardenticatenaceae bacterium]
MAAEREARRVVKQPSVRCAHCAALKTVSDDTFAMAKIVTPVLLALVAAGTLTIPPLPILYAAVAYTSARSGIAAFCADLGEAKAGKAE